MHMLKSRGIGVLAACGVLAAFVPSAVAQGAPAESAAPAKIEDAAEAKWWCTDLQNRVIDRCLQMFGGYGYMNEYPIARAYRDARVQPIYGGTNEIMKEIIGRGLGL